MPKSVDLAGQRFGALTVLTRGQDYISPASGKPSTRWHCLCDCGITTLVLTHALRTGNTSSCGCLGKAKRREACTKHKVSHMPEYKSWHSMVQRCTNKDNHNWHRYGGRGIAVCAEWVDDPARFYKDLGPRPSTRHSIDRIDVNGDYTPSNCRWADPKEQGRNRRNNVYVTYQGKQYVLSALAEQLNISTAVLSQRVFNLKWPETRWGAPVRKHASRLSGLAIKEHG